jgi:putative transposase
MIDGGYISAEDGMKAMNLNRCSVSSFNRRHVMTTKNERWGQFRLQVLGQLLASPPGAEETLANAVKELAKRPWTHPIKGSPVTFGASTIERWYYRAKDAKTDTVRALARRPRSDARGSMLDEILKSEIRRQHKNHPSWSAKLHCDNLQAFARVKGLADDFSYQSVRRYLRTHGLVRTKRRRGLIRPGEEAAHIVAETREIRSYEVSHVGGLWHLDFHSAKRPITTADGSWVTPKLFAVIDDRSRLICHLQWYLTETTQDLVHGFSQALMRRGLPRALMSDNGSAMTSEEFTEGLARLGILHETTLPYSPHQNGKMECFWGQLEGRLMAMLERKREVSLLELNRLTHAWVEMDYHHQRHSETEQTPIERFSEGPSVLRPSPDGTEIRQAFRMEVGRIQRRSDGTLTLDGVRFEVPGRFRHLKNLTLRYARWNLGDVSLMSNDTGQILCRLYPLDKEKNANGHRRQCSNLSVSGEGDNRPDDGREDVPPYLAELVKRFEDKGFSPPFISQT